MILLLNSSIIKTRHYLFLTFLLFPSFPFLILMHLLLSSPHSLLLSSSPFLLQMDDIIISISNPSLCRISPFHNSILTLVFPSLTPLSLSCLLSKHLQISISPRKSGPRPRSRTHSVHPDRFKFVLRSVHPKGGDFFRTK